MLLSAWASILVTIQLAPFATKIVDGNIDDLNAALYEELLAKLTFPHVNKSIIIKAVRKAGSYVPMYWPHNIYNLCGIMYGEACSAVPLYKTKKMN
jgi:hypothetical protein